MDKRTFIEAVASGLRKMDHTPDYMAILVDKLKEFEYDEDKICGIPVTKMFVSVNSGESGLDFPVIPCFNTLAESKIFMQTVWFQKGFSDVCSSFWP